MGKAKEQRITWKDSLIQDLAEGRLNGRQLAEKYGKSEVTISKLRNDEEINKAVADILNERRERMTNRVVTLAEKSVEQLDELLEPLTEEQVKEMPSYLKKQVALAATKASLEILIKLGILGNGSVDDQGTTNNFFGKVIVMPTKEDEKAWEKEAKRESK